MASIIKWTKQDKQALQKAVNNFNSKIRRLEKLGYDYLPQKTSVRALTNTKDLDNRRAIYSRRELRATIKRLQRFSQRDVEKAVRLQSGEIVSYYEKRELQYAKSRAIRQINKEMEELKYQKSIRPGMSMKDYELLEYRKSKLLDIENKKGYEYKQARELLEYNAYADRELRQANIWKENFLNALKDSNLKNKRILINKINSFKNPTKAFEFVSQTEVLKDLWAYYKEDANSSTYGGFDSNQDAFNYGLQQLGLIA